MTSQMDLSSALVLTHNLPSVLRDIVLSFTPLAIHLLACDSWGVKLCNRWLSDEDCTGLLFRFLESTQNTFSPWCFFTALHNACFYLDTKDSNAKAIHGLIVDWCDRARDRKSYLLCEQDYSLAASHFLLIQNKWSESIVLTYFAMVAGACGAIVAAITCLCFGPVLSWGVTLIMYAVAISSSFLGVYYFSMAIDSFVVSPLWLPRERKRFIHVYRTLCLWRTRPNVLVHSRNIVDMLEQNPVFQS